ncbi:hypothetical protein N9A81_00710 [Synechococcus sp. AH-707-M23]|nr:hypothetical protein [Synechococcus sp. AH-707-M23]
MNRKIKVITSVVLRYFSIIYKVPFSILDTFFRLPSLFSDLSAHNILVEIDDRDRGSLVGSSHYAQFLDPISDDLSSNCEYKVFRLSRLGSLKITNSWKSPYSFEFLFILTIFVCPFILIPLVYYRISLKFIFFISYYLLICIIFRPSVYISTSPTKACCILFSFFNIPVIDYQHGIISPHHTYYYRPHILHKGPFIDYPSHIFLWRQLPSISPPGAISFLDSITYNVGNPTWSIPPDNRLCSCEFFDELNSLSQLSSDADITLTYTTQPFKDSPLDIFFIDAVSQLVLKRKVNLIIRPHPVVLTFRSELSKLLHQISSLSLPNLTLSITYYLSFLELSRISTFHVTYHSTCVEDFAVFDVPSIGTSPDLKESGSRSSAFSYERSAGYLYLPTSTKHFVDIILDTSLVNSDPDQLPIVHYSPELLSNAVSDILASC